MKKTYILFSVHMSALVVGSMVAVKPALEPIKLGFIPLTDCAPLVAAKELGLVKKYGVDVELSKEASWANIRDKVLNGELDEKNGRPQRRPGKGDDERKIPGLQEMVTSSTRNG